MRTVEFFFDPISPYVYLSWHQVQTIQAHLKEVRFEMTPVLLAGFLNAHGQLGPAEIPAKRIYTIKDAMRWAVKLGIPYEGPPAHPFNPLKPLRVCTAIDEANSRFSFAGALLNAAWGEGKDITEDTVLLELATRLKLNGEALLSRSKSDEVKQKLRSQTESAIEWGAFGVPTFRVEREIFWGNDRLPFLLDHLKGNLTVDPKKLTQILNRPQAAKRSR